MARASVVSYEDVQRVMYELFQAGESTAFPAVYAKLGNKGSAKIVQGFMAQWREETRGKLLVQRQSPVLPENLVASADNLIETIWLQALGQADAAYKQAKGELELQRSEMEAEVARAWEQRDDAERQVLQLRGELEAERVRVTDRDLQLEAHDLRLAENQVALDERDRQLGEQRETLAGLTALLDSERNRHSAELALVRENHDNALVDLRATHAKELEREREYSEGERQFVMRELDAARELAKRDAETAKNEIGGLKVERDTFRTQANQARDQASMLRGKTEAQEEELGRLRETVAGVHLELADLREQFRAAEARHQAER